MKTFIRAIEAWVPDKTGSLLEFGGGIYGSARGFGAISRGMCFGRGEGLPGRAWEKGRPVILKQLADSYFLRARAARAAGLSCAIAIPWFAGAELSTVLVIFCGDDESHVGAIELWHNDAALSLDLALEDGVYGGTAELFEFLSRHTRFRKGNGLPGLAWESGLPVFMADLGKSTQFLRKEGALQAGITRGFALRCPSAPRPEVDPDAEQDTDVVAFLSALATPIVRRFETWLPDAKARHLVRSEGFCEARGMLPALPPSDRIERGAGAIGQALAKRTPHIAEQAGAEPDVVGDEARAGGLQALVALPVLKDGVVLAVVAWYF